jgi:hypothetical protein
MRRFVLAALASSLLLVATEGTSHAVLVALVHGKYAGTPTTGQAWDYFNATTSHTCNGGNGVTNGSGEGSVVECKAGSIELARGYAYVGVSAYDGKRSWFANGSTADPVCKVANDIKNWGATDPYIRGVGHSMGGMVLAALVDDAVNGIVGGCGSGVISSAYYYLDFIAAVSSPFRGSKTADAAYGHLNNGGNPLTDWLHNFCGNTIGGIVSLFTDERVDSTYYLQTGIAPGHAGQIDQLGGVVLRTSWGTATSGNDSIWLGAAASCVGMPTPHDGLVPKHSARGCNTQGTGTCSSGSNGRPSAWGDGIYQATGHSSNRRNNHVSSNNSHGHSHGFSRLVRLSGGL